MRIVGAGAIGGLTLDAMPPRVKLELVGEVDGERHMGCGNHNAAPCHMLVGDRAEDFGRAGVERDGGLVEKPDGALGDKQAGKPQAPLLSG